MNEQNERMKLLIALQPKFREAMGPLQHGDRVLLKNDPIDDFYCIDCLEYEVFSPKLYNGCLRLPLPIDPRNPERGIWGMIDWSIYDYTSGLDNTMAIWDKTRLLGPGQFSIATTPELALLKALAHQEGMEVK